MKGMPNHMTPMALDPDFDPPPPQKEEARKLVGIDKGRITIASQLTEEEGDRTYSFASLFSKEE